jgi:hypothetical protein
MLVSLSSCSFLYPIILASKDDDLSTFNAYIYEMFLFF